MKKLFCIGLIAGLVCAAQAGLTHRYLFDGNVDDAVGVLHGVATEDSDWLEAPQYTNDVPAGAVAGAPFQSLEVGLSAGVKNSGFTISGDIIPFREGSISVWVKTRLFETKDI